MYQAAAKPMSMAMVADHFTQSGTPWAASSTLSVDDQRALEEVLDVLGVAEEEVVEHRAREHRAGGEDDTAAPASPSGSRAASIVAVAVIVVRGMGMA